MPWPFTNDRRDIVGVVRHLQTQMALQQLGMEINNDALRVAADAMTGDEVFHRGNAQVTDRGRVRDYLLPAVEQKQAIIQQMIAENEAFEAAGFPKEARSAMQLWGECLTIQAARANLHRTHLTDFVNGQGDRPDPRIGSMDSAEQQAQIAATYELNALIVKAGLLGDAFISLNHEVVNSVRARIDLEPISKTDFHARLLSGTAGGRARFYN